MAKLLKDVMTAAPETVRVDATVQEAAVIMRDCDTGFLPVLRDDEIAGVLTDRDIVVRTVADGDDPLETEVGQIMTAEFHALFEDQTVDEALDLMEAQQIRRLLVLDRSEEIVGVLSLGDVAVRTEDDHGSERVFEKVSIPDRKKPGARPGRDLRN